MKVTVQNGANHALSRAIVERSLADIPSAWEDEVDEVLIRAETAKEPQVRFHHKKRSLEVCGPVGNGVEACLEQMLTALSIISARGNLPRRLGSALRADHAQLARAALNKAGRQP